MKISLIVAMSKNRVIGKDGGIPWRLSDDQKNFRKVTMGHPIIMGRKTHESIGRPLDGRLNIVLTRDENYEAEGCRVVHSLDEAIDTSGDTTEVFIIGGEAIYEMCLPQTDRIYLSQIQANIDGDTFFPMLDMNEWHISYQESHSDTDDKHTYPYIYYILERNNH